MKEELEKLVATLEKTYITRLEGSELIDAYYGEGDADICDWMSGNFNDDLDLGNRIGSYEVASEACAALNRILGK